MTGGQKAPVLVTGGGGFLGSAIVRLLRAEGQAVRSLTRRPYPELDALGVAQFLGDVADPEIVSRAVAGCETVFHVAAKAGLWGPYPEYHRSNVVGTQNVIAACREHGVRRLIYTSSTSVVFKGHNLEGVDESVPYAKQYDAAYPATKAIAEKLVLANNDSTLATVSLRPHLIWGPGDNNILPRIYARARAHRLFRIGPRNPLIDPTYIDNAALAHLLAADRLEPGSLITGRAYFIAQGQPVPLWDMVNRFLEVAHLPPVKRSIPLPLALMLGGFLETLYTLLRLPGEPRMTRFLALELSTAHWYNLDAARRDLGYSPRVSIEEGLRRLAESVGAGPE
ncbi:MAG TPA: NAD-dependent epimerase/dehydratase family protein [Acidimicrobiales bacterium]|nr:NAD-dependent epimerase/dehydratase family protein [Acidimicrobiales bacterium]